MGLIARVPGGYYDVTDYAGLTTAAKYNGTDAVDAALKACLDYCSDNDLTALFPRNTRWQITNTLWQEDVIDGGHHTSPGTVSIVGQQGGTMPEIFLGSGATANGFSKTATLGANANSIPMVHFYKNAVPNGAYPPASETPETFYGGTIQGVKLNGSGYANCSVLCFDAAQDCVLSDVVIEATGCYAGLVGWPGRGVAARNIEIIGGRYGVYQRHPYRIENQSTAIGIGGHFLNCYIHGQTHYGLWTQGTRGALTMTGLKLSMASGVGWYTQSSSNIERGQIALWDSIIEMTVSGIAIQANAARVAVFNSYFKNCSTIMDSVETTEPDYAGSSTGWYYVKRYINSPTTGSVANRLSINGVARTDDVVDTANGVVTNAPDPKLTTQYYWREDDFTDNTKVIWATDHTGTSAPWTSTTAACTPVLSSDLTTDNKTLIENKIAECVSAGKVLFFPRGAAIGQGYYPVGGLINLPAGLKGIMGGVCKRISFPPTSAWKTSQTSSGTQSWVFSTEDSASSTTYMAYMLIPTLYYTAARVAMIRWRSGKGRIVQCWGSNQAAGRIDYPNVDVLITGNGGGYIVSLRNGGSCTDPTVAREAADTTDRRWIRVKDTSQPLTIIGCDPEFGGAMYRTPTHPALVDFDNATNWRVIGAKCEAWQNVFNFRNGSQGIIGPIGDLIGVENGTAPAATPKGVFAIDGSSAVEVFSVTKSGSGGTGYTASTVPLFEETGVSPAAPAVYSNQVVNYYRRGSTLDVAAVWKSYSDSAAPAAPTYAASSTKWYVYFEGADPTTSDLAVASIELAETFGGPDIATTASSVTASSGGTGAANLTDGNDATDFTATADVAVKFTFSSAKAISEVRWKPSASGSNVPLGIVVECYDATRAQLRRMLVRRWEATATGTRVARFNRRTQNADTAARARTKNTTII